MTAFYDQAGVVVGAVGLLQAGFFCLLLRSEGRRAFRANRWMMLFAAAVALNLVEDMIEVLGGPVLDAYGSVLFTPANFLIGPAIYLYFREICGRPAARPWVHFIIAAVVANVALWGVGAELEALTGSSGVNATGIADRPQTAVHLTLATVLYVQAATYVLLIWRLAARYLRQVQVQLDAQEASMRRWLRDVLGSVMVMFLTFGLTEIAAAVWSEADELFFLILETVFVAVFFRLSYVLASQQVVFVMPDWQEDADASPGASPADAEALSVPQPAARALLSEDEAERVAERLAAIRTEGVMLSDPMVSLPRLAQAAGVSPNQLSYVLNQHLGQSFFDFVNGARIDEAKRLLVGRPELSILDVAMTVGFNSKSTFNLAFKKLAGETPSNLRKRTAVTSG